MKNIFIKILCLCLLLAMIIPLGVACNNTGDGNDTTTPDNGGETPGGDTGEELDDFGRPLIPSTLPANLDYGNETIYTLNGGNWDNDLLDRTIDILAESQYTRNMEVEETLNIQIETIEEVVTGGGNTVFNNHVINSYLADDHEFDILDTFTAYTTNVITSGYFLNLNLVDNIDMSHPGWNSYFAEQTTLMDQMYIGMSYSSNSTLTQIFCMFYNIDLFQKWFPEIDIYQVIDDGKWTIDYFSELVTGVYEDLNQNNEIDQEDLFGMTGSAHSLSIDGVFWALGLGVTKINDDDIPEFTLYDEKIVDAWDKMYSLLWENTGVFTREHSDAARDFTKANFANGNSMFLTMIFGATSAFREMEDDYGVLPIYKYNEEQDDYYTTIQDSWSSVAIMANCLDMERAGAVLQLLSELSYRSVVPTYYEVMLKLQYSTTDKNAAIYDLLVANTRLDFGYVYGKSLGNAGTIWKTMAGGKIKDYTSKYSGSIDSWNTLLGTLVEFFEELA